MDLYTLPDLPEPTKRERFSSLKSLRSSVDDAISGNVGGVDYDLSAKRLQLQTRINDAVATGKLKPNGEWNLNIEKPLFGGNLSFDANSSKDPSYYLKWQKSF